MHSSQPFWNLQKVAVGRYRFFLTGVSVPASNMQWPVLSGDWLVGGSPILSSRTFDIRTNCSRRMGGLWPTGQACLLPSHALPDYTHSLVYVAGTACNQRFLAPWQSKESPPSSARSPQVLFAMRPLHCKTFWLWKIDVDIRRNNCTAIYLNRH